MNYTVDIKNKQIIYEGLTEKQLKALIKVFGPQDYGIMSRDEKELRDMPTESYRYEMLDTSNLKIYKSVDHDLIKKTVTEVLKDFDETGMI